MNFSITLNEGQNIHEGTITLNEGGASFTALTPVVESQEVTCEILEQTPVESVGDYMIQVSPPARRPLASST